MVNYDHLPKDSRYFTGELYQKMNEDLQLAGMSKRTVHGYLRAVRQLADYCKRKPDKISEAQLRRYFLYLKNEKEFAYGSIRVAFSGIKFFYTRTCKRSWETLATMKLKRAKTLPEVLTIEQVPPNRRRLPSRTDCVVLLDRLLDGTAARRDTEPPGGRRRCQADVCPHPSR